MVEEDKKEKKESRKRKSVNREQIYKEVREEKQRHVLERLIIEFGDVLLPLYIVVSSLWITLSAILYIYAREYGAFNDLIASGYGSVVIYSFALLAILLFACWAGLGIGAFWSYKAHLKLKSRGVRKKLGLIHRLLKNEKYP